jgi:hypothetical protein
MPNVNKYKSVGVTVETYEKLVLIAEAQNRNLCQQFKMLVDRELDALTTPTWSENLNR